MAPRMSKWILEGWTYTNVRLRDGSWLKCHTNVLGQKFESFKALMNYVRLAKREKLSTYAPGFDASKVRKCKSVVAASSKIEPLVVANLKEKSDEAAGKESLGSSAHASDQSEKCAVVKPLSIEGPKNPPRAIKRLSSGPLAHVLPRRSPGLAGIRSPGPERSIALVVKPLSTEGPKNRPRARKRLSSALVAHVLPRRSPRLAGLPAGKAPLF